MIKKEHKEEKDNKKYLKNFIIIGLLILFLFIVFFFSIKYTKTYFDKSNTDKRVIYNNYEFKKYDDNKWYVELEKNNQPYEIAFYYNPYEVENISITNNTIPQFREFLNRNPGGTVYITVNPDENSRVIIASVELGKILGKKYNFFNFNVKAAFTQESMIKNVSDTGYPIITCANSSKNKIVIWFTPAETTEIITQNYCIAIKYANVNESIKAADALAFKLLTIIR